MVPGRGGHVSASRRVHFSCRTQYGRVAIVISSSRDRESELPLGACASPLRVAATSGDKSTPRDITNYRPQEFRTSIYCGLCDACDWISLLTSKEFRRHQSILSWQLQRFKVFTVVIFFVLYRFYFIFHFSILTSLFLYIFIIKRINS